MRAELTAAIPVHRVAVFAEMAWLERRPELGLLCRTARDSGNRITPATVQGALPGLSDAGAQNVIGWCHMLGLCDGRGGLTALGEDVALHDEAPVPEQGVYGLWLAQHPVLGSRVLCVERLASKRDPRFQDIEPLQVRPDQGRVFRSVVEPKERFMVRELPSNHDDVGCVPGTTQARCRLRWTLDFDKERDQWKLDGLVEAPAGNGKHALRSIQHAPESEALDLWHLVETWATGPLADHGRWDGQDRRLAVPTDGLSDAERDSFRKALPVGRVEIPGKGTYDDVTIEDVPIGPASAHDAQRWALDRLDRHLEAEPGYRSRAAVRDAFAELTEHTPLESFRPRLPSHADLVHRARATPARFWHLAAPVDLAPFPDDDDVLGELVVGATAPSPVREIPGTVRVPYRGGWSMQRLVDRLLAGTTPARVLLVDRYVRGAGNLDTLRLLVQSIRSAAPTCGVDIWTDDTDADLGAIRAITGSPPRTYRQAFGRDWPHNRYLLVRPAHGDGFGWDMSNSPLHARAEVTEPSPRTPLRWKDLAAARVTADELRPAFRQWLLGGGR